MKGFGLGFLWSALVLVAQTPTTFQYFYDDIGQLTKVVDSTGIVIEYVYDAVGNMLQIKRSSVSPGVLTIFSVTPQQAGPLTQITIQGQGFSSTPTGNTVRFNGVAATVISATTNKLVVEVPIGALTGLVSVTVGSATASSPSVFTIVPAPVISSTNPKTSLPNTTLAMSVTGVNLTGSAFSFQPAFVPSVVAVTSATINPSGTAATLSLTISAGAVGKFVLVATNPQGSSTGFLTSGNSFSVVNASADFDADGLSDLQEAAIGTDAFNHDTDGDGFPDGVEVASGSDPLNPACTPLNCRLTGEADGIAFSVRNTPSGAITEPASGQATSALKKTAVGNSLDDPDGDGLPDGEEHRIGTDPFNPDSDGDGYPDGLEMALGSNPLNATSLPDIRPPAFLIVPVGAIEMPESRRPKADPQIREGEPHAQKEVLQRKGAWSALVRLRALFLGRQPRAESDFQQRVDGR